MGATFTAVRFCPTISTTMFGTMTFSINLKEIQTRERRRIFVIFFVGGMVWLDFEI